jgi:hypothetical protein
VPLPLAVLAGRLVEDIDQLLQEARDCGYDPARMLDSTIEVSFAAMALGLRRLPLLEGGRDAWEREATTLRRAAEAMAAGGAAVAWTPADNLSRWANLFGVGVRTFKKQLAAGQIRFRRLSTKTYQIAVDDLPAKHRAKYLPPSAS